VDENQQLSDTFRVPDLKTGRMVRLITQLTPKEEEMFRNMVRRMNNLCRVSVLVTDELNIFNLSSAIEIWQ
jgi:proline dehydrogenase